MKKINIADINEETWESPKGKFKGHGKSISIALGREPASTDLMKRHPFDIEMQRIAPGCTPCPFHSHSAQWEFYQVIEGTGKVRHDAGETEIAPGDAFIFKPGENHQLINTGTTDLLLFMVADNPFGESYYYPDSDKCGVPLPSRKWMRGPSLPYFDGEE